MDRFLENLRREAEANPTMALAVGAAFLTAVSKLINAHGQSKGSRAYARDVERRIRQSK